MTGIKVYMNGKREDDTNSSTGLFTVIVNTGAGVLIGFFNQGGVSAYANCKVDDVSFQWELNYCYFLNNTKSAFILNCTPASVVLYNGDLCITRRFEII